MYDVEPVLRLAKHANGHHTHKLHTLNLQTNFCLRAN